LPIQLDANICYSYIFFQLRSHRGLYEDILHKDDYRDTDRYQDLHKEKLTMTECVVAFTFAATVVSFMAVYLTERIEYIVKEHHIKDA
jgi:Ca2+:H+ antiporter